MLRITSGIHRGRLIQSLAGDQTRPTTERLRQAWLNSLQPILADARILDLFAGSGALGLEALSRGAGFVVFVEENSKAASILQKNIQTLQLQDQAQVMIKRAETYFKLLKDESPFDFIFADPPYDQKYEEKMLAEWPWSEVLTESGRFCLESAYRKAGSKIDSALQPPPSLKIVRDERYGDTQLTFYALKEKP